jgi:mono/diheme cytochrome c family protein
MRHRCVTPRTLLIAAGSGAAALAMAAGQAEPKVDFTRDVRPILEAKCFACHGAKHSKGGLRLDVKQQALLGGDSGQVIKSGHANESLLLQLVSGADPKKVMPPAGPRLTPAQVKVLRDWIDQGATWPEPPPLTKGGPGGGSGTQPTHWSFRPVKRPALPKVKNQAWVRNPIDAFVLAKLEAKGLKPSPAADRVTLIRRLSLDLLGLPPSVEDVEAFVNDRSADAYEKLVDRLLTSPHYGERWGRLWLDEARYSDTNGYTIDSPRQIWMYRDWVINALNRDLPFDQFTIEQLAGDLLPNPAPEQLIATGFHRNTMINEEGGTDPEQFRVEAVVDRVATTGSVWLGLTLGCAQCHTHKFDPITQREYYQFFAFFNNAEEPSLPFPTPKQQQEQGELKQRLAAAQQKLTEYQKTAAIRQAAWEQRAVGGSSADWTVLRPDEHRSAAGSTLQKLDDGSLLLTGNVPDNDVYTVSASLPRRATALRLEVLTHDSLPNGGPGLAKGNFLLTDFVVSAEQPGGGAQPAPIARAVADHAQQDYPVTLAVDDQSNTGWAINVKGGEGRLNTDRTAVFLLERPVPAGARLTVTLKQEHSNKRYLIGRFRLSAAEVAPDALQWLPSKEVRDLLDIPAGMRTPAQRETLAKEFARAESNQFATEIAALEAREKELAKSVSTTMIMRERTAPRETFIHLRGDFLRRGDAVAPGVPAAFPSLPQSSTRLNRLDLARWLVDPRNPLTPRVTVNRVWQSYFGIGIVETENDFGTQGAEPSHPELLDWLALEFAGPRDTASTKGAAGSATADPYACGWSLKRLHRLIVTSNTYKQSSKARPELAVIDPTNRLLARQNRLRLEGELVRDVTLAASGLLSRKMGGPGVYPPQPAGTDLFTQVKRAWPESKGEDRYRRGVYTWQWRSNPYALFATFDGPNGTVTCTRRLRSNTPTQALMLANDQSLFEMAQALAVRTMSAPATTDADRIRHAFLRCLSRPPTDAEAARLLAFYRAQVQSFTTAAADAASVAPKERPAGFGVPEAAAWTSVARVIMNVDEFITRE